MLDLKFIRENRDLVFQNIKARGVIANVDLVIELDEKRRELILKLDSLRNERNINADRMKNKISKEERESLIEEGKKIKDEIKILEEELKTLINNLREEHKKIPNIMDPSVPNGAGDDSNIEIKRWGLIPKFDFKVKDHMELAHDLELIDFENARKLSGNKFYYLINEAVFLELALIRFALDILREEGFKIYMTPDIARNSIIDAVGFNPRGKESNVYNIEETDKSLIGTAEITLAGLFKDEIIDFSRDKILKIGGYSHCFRKEAGAAGQYSKGLYRVHQFSKVEMFSFTREECSNEVLENFLKIEEKIFQKLELPYRVLNICSGDLGAPAYKKYDIEAWMPGRAENGDWGELTSTSNCTDYQARRLNIRYRDSDNKLKMVHMINGTAIATTRTILAIIENFQTKEGDIIIPQALRVYTGFDKISKKI